MCQNRHEMTSVLREALNEERLSMYLTEKQITPDGMPTYKGENGVQRVTNMCT